MQRITFFMFLIMIFPLSYSQEMNEMWGEQISGLNVQDAGRGQLFRDGNYAMFIHWGLYSQIANEWKGKTYYGIGEWIMNKNMANIPVKEYMEVAKDFNPVKFDAEGIVQLAKDAGMKYIIITSKHHDGFSMYHSKVNMFNIVDATPFARDPMKELAQACKNAGLGFGFYYSHNQDWTNPEGTIMPEESVDDPASFESYFKYKCLPQVEEITTQYGRIELVWFDTPGRISREKVQQLVDIVRKNQPQAYISGRVGHGLGDYTTLGDMEVPVRNHDGIWETVDVTNDSWGYAWYDQNWKNPKEILMRLISTVARGGTYMLNIGPKPDGSIPEQAAYSLRKSGEWIHRYPQVVYGTDASPWQHALPWGDITVKDKKLFLSVYEWPASGKIYLPGLQTDIVSVEILAGKKRSKLKFSKEQGWTILELPCIPPEELVSVVELTLKDKAKVETTQAIDPYMPLILPADFAETKNCRKNKKQWMEKFGEWKHVMQIDQWKEGSAAIWEINFKEAGDYMVELTYSGKGKLVWTIESETGTKIQNQQNSSAIYHTFPFGWLNIGKSGKQKITVTLQEGDRNAVSLMSLKLKKVN